MDKTGGARSAGTTVSVVPGTLGPIEVHVGLKGLVTKDDELKRIEKGIATIKKDLEHVRRMT